MANGPLDRVGPNRVRSILLAKPRSALRAITTISIDAPARTLLLWILAGAFLSIGATRLEIETSISSLLDTRSKSWSEYQDSIDSHGSDEFLTILIDGRSASLPEILSRSAVLTNAIEEIDGVKRVDGPSSVALIRPSADGGVSISPAIRAIDSADRDIPDIAQRLLDDEIYRDAYVAHDATAAALSVILDEHVAGDRDEVVRAIVGQLEAGERTSGVPIFRTSINRDIQNETAALLPGVLIAIALIAAWAFRSARAIVIPLAAGGFGSLATAGALGYTGVPLSISTMILPSIQLALGCAYSMHFLCAVRDAKSVGELTKSILSIVSAVAVSGATTALGFLSLSISPIETIRQLALFGAFGVVCSTAFCVSGIPAILALQVTKGATIARAPSDQLQRIAESRVLSLCLDRPYVVIGAWTALTILCSFGLARLEVSTNIIDWYSHDTEIRADYERIRSALSGITPVSLFIRSSGESSLTSVETLEAIDRFSSEFESRPEVGKVLSIAHPIRLTHAAFNDGDRSIPNSREEIQQYLLLLESEEAIWDLLSRDYSSARILMRLNDNGSQSIIDLARDAEEWWLQNAPSGTRAVSTGLMFEFAKTNQAIVSTQILGLLIAFGGVTVVLWAILGSLPLAAAALVPNLIPLTTAYGLMGVSGVPLDAGTACLGSLALGIAVDDTVHIASRWSQARAQGLSDTNAASSAVAHAFPALTLSTACIVTGFAVLGTSDLGIVRNLGLVTAGVVFICWLADITLLPALLGGWRKR